MTWPLPITPRRWQAEALPRVLDAMRQKRRPVVQAATGSGKSILLAAVCKTIADSPKTGDAAIVVTTPTEALVTQLAATIGQYVECGRYYGKRKDLAQRVIVCCVPSLPSLVGALGRPVVAWLADECHRSLASERALKAIEGLAPKSRLGCTATPWRTEEPIPGWGAPLCVQYGIREAIADGAILPPHVQHWTDESETIDRDEATIRLLREHAVAPVVISAESIDDAEAFARRASDEWAPTEAIHSRMDTDEIDDAIGRLRSGALSGLVHVKLLVEGADYPWLRTLALRHRRTSLGLVQEVGRVLRVDPANPDKRHGLILDPLAQLPPLAVNDGSALLKEARLGEDDALSQLLGAAADEAVALYGDGLDDEESLPTMKVIPAAVAVGMVSRWAVRLVGVAASAGLDTGRILGRHEPATDRQIEAFRRHAWKPRGVVSNLPPNARAGIRALAENPARLTRYGVSALLAVIFAVGRQRSEDFKRYGDWSRCWRWPADLDVEPLDAAALAAVISERVA